jgi:outer membrane receptor protein involved in Fe transport
MRSIVLAILCAALMSLITSLQAAENLQLAELQYLSLLYEEDDLISIVTKHPQSLRDAPAIASVITAREIRQMGAHRIHDVLQRIPGFDVKMTPAGAYILNSRGTFAQQKIKFMLDGHTIRGEVNNGIGWAFNTIDLTNVKRIELIRGPASSLYGSTAYMGIVNIVTNDGEDVDGVISSVGIGSYNTKQATLQLGGREGNLEYVFFLNRYKTDAARLFLEQDSIGNSGKTDFWEDQVDFAAKFNYSDWQLNSRFIERKSGPYIGIGQALNDESKLKFGQYFVDLSHQLDISEQHKISGKIFYDRSTDWDQYWQFTPASFRPPIGTLAQATGETEAYGAELQFDTQPFRNNLFTLGAAVEYRRLFNAHFYNNFYSATVEEMDDDLNWIDDSKTKRDIWALYMQDIWTLSEQVTLTLGLRHDKYSDIGRSTSPKVAVVWKMDDHWDLKAQYAQGFKAPSFADLYVQSNPAEIGNPNLKPEVVDTYELSLGYMSRGDVNARLTYFNITEKDRIQGNYTGTGMAENVEGTEVEGVEFEWEKEFGLANNIYLNLTLQDARNTLDNSKVADVAMQKGNIGGDYLINRYININTNIFLTGDKPREAGDSRGDHKGYAVTDMTITFSRYIIGLEVRASVKNLFDREYSSPSFFNPPPSAYQVADYPREGRNYSLDMRYSF